MKKATDKRTLAVVPCYNEDITIASIILKAKQYTDEVLVVDDGSTDSTKKIAEEAGATVISHKRNGGKSAGIKTGFKYALANDFDYVVTLDGDGQHNPDEIPTVLEQLLKDNGIDISIGSRFGNSTEIPMWRRIGKRILDYATSFGNGGYITDSQCGFRAFNKKAIKAITPRLNGKAFTVESEQLIKAHELGLGVAHTKVTCKYKNLNTSTCNPTSHGFSVLSYVIWLVAERRPLLFISVPGFILVMLGLFFGIQTLQYYNETHVFLVSYAVLVSILMIIGVLAMFMGLMLNVLPRMIKQTREEELK
jgi:glycosyltransferase involved in cell wall biosynthesis